ncbi:hypothetical protein DL96DRAFT_1685631 [Flagelloscypha sp. PMI_526]|nr:hypothetical protein DL96DRAFT_1685631 [Flagelloscypha sp. PMI_526]
MDDQRLQFFGTVRGSQLAKYIKSLELGVNFMDRHSSLVSSFVRVLDGSLVRSLRLVGYSPRSGIPETILIDLYTLVMPHLHLLDFYEITDIPLIDVLSHCALLREVVLDMSRTAPSEPNRLVTSKTLPNIQSITLVIFWAFDFASSTSLRAYLQEKGSSIEFLTVGHLNNERIPFSVDMFPTLRSSLRQLTFDLLLLEDLSMFPSSSEFILGPTPPYSPSQWPLFDHFLNQHFEHACFPVSLTAVHMDIVAASGWSLDPGDSMSASSQGGTHLRPTSKHFRLYITLHISDEYILKFGITITVKALIKEYDLLQQAIESRLGMWISADRLIVMRQYGSETLESYTTIGKECGYLPEMYHKLKLLFSYSRRIVVIPMSQLEKQRHLNANIMYASITDLKSCALGEFFLPKLGPSLGSFRPSAWSTMWMAGWLFLIAKGVVYWLNYTQSLVLGSDFWTFEDQDITTSFYFEPLDGSMIHTLHVKNQREWKEEFQASLFIFCTNRDASSYPGHVELGVFSTSSGDSTIDFKTLPQFRSLTIVHWDIADWQHPHRLANLTWRRLNISFKKPPLHFNELPKLETLEFTVDPKYIRWRFVFGFQHPAAGILALVAQRSLALAIAGH